MDRRTWGATVQQALINQQIEAKKFYELRRTEEYAKARGHLRASQEELEYAQAHKYDAARIKALLEQLEEAEEAIAELLEEHGARDYSERQALKEVLPGTDAPFDFSIGDNELPERTSARSNTERAVEFVQAVFNDEVYTEPMTVGIQLCLPQDEDRACYRSQTNRVYVTAWEDTKVIVHEFGHGVERWDAHVHQRCVEFLHMRAEDSETEWLGPGFKDYELGLPGDWLHPYVGKLYGSWEDPVATEVLSMGLQWLYEKPNWFRENDPEMFNFIVGIVTGWI